MIILDFKIINNTGIDFSDGHNQMISNRESLRKSLEIKIIYSFDKNN